MSRLGDPGMRIAIDPNVRVEGNRTFAGFEDIIDGTVSDLKVGDAVTVIEEESGAVGDATVYKISHDDRLIYLTVDWPSLRLALSESDTTVEQFDAMWDQSQPGIGNFVLSWDGNRYVATPAPTTAASGHTLSVRVA